MSPAVKSKGQVSWKDMKPATRKAILLTSGVVCLIACAVFFLLLPAMETRVALRQQAERDSAEADALQQKIRATSGLRLTVEAEEQALKELRDSGVLKDVMTSWEEPAVRYLLPFAEANGIQIDRTRSQELPTQPIWSKPPKVGTHYFVRKPIEFVALGPYPALAKFIQDVEAGLPLASFSKFEFRSTQRNVEVQELAFRVEWPIWVVKPADPKAKGK